MKGSAILMENEVNIINSLNDLIYNAVEHGGDSGGSYNSNTERLHESVENVLKVLNLDNRYIIKWEWVNVGERIPVIVGRNKQC